MLAPNNIHTSPMEGFFPKKHPSPPPLVFLLHVSFITPPPPPGLPVTCKLHKFLERLCSSRTPNSSGNSNLFCGGTVGELWVEGGKGVGEGYQSRITLNFSIESCTHHDFFSPITRHVKRSKYIANFTFLTLKTSLKRELYRFNHKNASSIIRNIFHRKQK